MSGRLDHESPSHIPPGAMYLIKAYAYYRVRNTFCHAEIGGRILDSIQLRNEKKIWYSELAMLMPDHVHLILSFSDETPMTRAMGNWKSWLAKTEGIR